MLVINLFNLTVGVCTTSSNIQKFFILLTYFIYVFCIYLATNSEFRPIQHPMISFFYNRGHKCLLRGTNWVFK